MPYCTLSRTLAQATTFHLFALNYSCPSRDAKVQRWNRSVHWWCCCIGALLVSFGSGSELGSAGPRSPFAAMKADPAGASAPSREEAQPLARPAGAAEDTGGCAALDGKSDRRGHASRPPPGAQAARSNAQCGRRRSH